MRAHEKPDFSFSFVFENERKSLEKHRFLEDRRVPERSSDNLIIASWNLTNFGLQKREKDHIKLIAEIMKPFDVIALQEIADDVEQFNMLLEALLEVSQDDRGVQWEYLYTDVAGNNERLEYVFRADRVTATGLAAELAMRGYERITIIVEGVDPEENPFTGFNRNPYMASFVSGKLKFYLVNVHLYWSNMALRRLEAKALAKWAKSRVKKPGPPNEDIILIGDFNMPHARPGDSIYDELTNYGLMLPKHTTDLIGTNLAGDKHYDEIAFFPGRTKRDFTGRLGVFDFDNAIFQDLWNETAQKDRSKFFQYIRYYIADHRPLWAEFKR
jgi:endonuclease/exonuclease/phosphatase family metal-dependent hydrolase